MIRYSVFPRGGTKLTLDLQEAVRLSSKANGISGLEELETSGHMTALDELSQRMLQKVRTRSSTSVLIAGTFITHRLNHATSRAREFHYRNTGNPPTVNPANHQTSLEKPKHLIQAFNEVKKTMSKKNNSWRRSEKWPLGLLDETRKRIADEAEEGLVTMKQDLVRTGKELKYTQGVVASELGAFQAEHAERARHAIVQFVTKQVEVERGRLRGMERALSLVKTKGKPSLPLRLRGLESKKMEKMDA